jgi:hypothetical protein
MREDIQVRVHNILSEPVLLMAVNVGHCAKKTATELIEHMRFLCSQTGVTLKDRIRSKNWSSCSQVREIVA